MVDPFGFDSFRDCERDSSPTQVMRSEVRGLPGWSSEVWI